MRLTITIFQQQGQSSTDTSSSGRAINTALTPCRRDHTLKGRHSLGESGN
ncbi:hypothetical protein LINPERHAP1_LOCUS17525, partial [Linum perenne]